MLASEKVMAFLATTDGERAKEFFRDRLGLTYLSEDPFAIVFDLNGIMLRISPVKSLTPQQFTVLGWQVGDIAETVASLHKAGVTFEKFGFPGQDENGIWSAPGGAKVAWFKDPDGNVLSVSQHP